MLLGLPGVSQWPFDPLKITDGLRVNEPQMKMKSGSLAKDSYIFKIGILKICKSLKWENPSKEILKETVKFFNQCMIERRTKQILKKIRLQMTRQKAKISVKNTKNNELYKRSMMTHAVKLYKNLPEAMKELTKKEFRRKLRTMYFDPP